MVFLHGSWKGPIVGPVLELLTLQPVLMQTEEDTEGAVAPLLWELSELYASPFIHELTRMDLGVILVNVHHHTHDPGSQGDHKCILVL